MKKYLPILLFLSIIIPVSAQNDKTDKLQSLEQGQSRQQTQQSTTATLKSAARLFGAKDDLTTVVMIIPTGSRVTILDSDSTYFLVHFEDSEGYIFKRQAVIDKSQPVSTQDNNTQEPVQQTRPVETAKASRFSYLEDKYGTSLAARINAGKIWKGMSPEMVRDSWGNPDKISRVISGNTVKEDWTYKSTWLYFQSNTLIEWGPARNNK